MASFTISDLVTKWGFDVDENKLKSVDKEFGKLQNKADVVAAKFEKVGAKLKSVGKGFSAGVTAPIMALAAISLKAAASLDFTNRKFKFLFGDSSSEVNNWVNSIEKSVVRGTGTIKGVLNTVQPLIKGYGIAGDEATEMAKGLTTVAFSMSEFNEGMSDDSASKILARALSGGVKGLNKYGIAITTQMLEEERERMGLKGSVETLDAASAARVRFNVVMRQAKDVMNFSAENSASLEMKTRKLKERFADITEVLGGPLLDSFSKIIGKFADLADKMSRMDKESVDAIVKWGLLVAAIGPVLIATGFMVSAIGKIILFIKVLKGLALAYRLVGISALWAQVQMFLIPIAIIAVVGIITYFVYKNWDKIAAFFVGAYLSAKKAFLNAIVWIMDNWLYLVSFPVALIVYHWAEIKKFFAFIWSMIVKAFGFAFVWLKKNWLYLVSFPIALIIKNWDKIRLFFKGIWSKVKNALKSVAKYVYKFLSDTLTGSIKKIKDGLTKLKNKIPFLKDKIDIETTVPDTTGTEQAAMFGLMQKFASIPSFLVPNMSGISSGSGNSANNKFEINVKNEYTIASNDPSAVVNTIAANQDSLANEITTKIANDLRIKLGLLGVA